MSERVRHSKLGIASIILAIGIWIYFIITFYLVFYSEYFHQVLNALLPSSERIADFRAFGAAIVLLAFLLIGIPLGGHLVGFIFGVFGFLAKTRKRIFAVIGLVLNSLPFVLGLTLYLIGSVVT